MQTEYEHIQEVLEQLRQRVLVARGAQNTHRLAMAMGLDPATVYRFLNRDERCNLRQKTLLTIAQWLDNEARHA